MYSSKVEHSPHVKHRDSHRTLLDFHPSCPHSHPRHHTSSPGVYKECCCTGTHPGGSVYPLKQDSEMGKEELIRHNLLNTSTSSSITCFVFLTAAVTFLLIAAIHAVSISVTAPADGDAMAIFALELIAVTLHITAILDQEQRIIFISAPWYVRFQSGMLIREEIGWSIPRPNHQHNRGLRHTSSARQCNGHLCRQTRSLNTDEALRAERRQA